MSGFNRNARIIDCGSTAGRVPHVDIKGKVDQVIKDDTVISINENVATVPFRGRPFTMCIHSDLPGKYTYPDIRHATYVGRGRGSHDIGKSLGGGVQALTSSLRGLCRVVTTSFTHLACLEGSQAVKVLARRRAQQNPKQY